MTASLASTGDDESDQILAIDFYAMIGNVDKHKNPDGQSNRLATYTDAVAHPKKDDAR